MRRWIPGLAAIVALVALGLLFHARLTADFWPLDASRVGPNLVAAVVQGLLVVGAMTVLYPPWRHAVERFADRALAPVHRKLTTIIGHHRRHAKDLAELHRKLDHVIAHSDMPPLPRKPRK